MTSIKRVLLLFLLIAGVLNVARVPQTARASWGGISGNKFTNWGGYVLPAGTFDNNVGFNYVTGILIQPTWAAKDGHLIANWVGMGASVEWPGESLYQMGSTVVQPPLGCVSNCTGTFKLWYEAISNPFTPITQTPNNGAPVYIPTTDVSVKPGDTIQFTIQIGVPQANCAQFIFDNYTTNRSHFYNLCGTVFNPHSGEWIEEDATAASNGECPSNPNSGHCYDKPMPSTTWGPTPLCWAGSDGGCVNEVKDVNGFFHNIVNATDDAYLMTPTGQSTDAFIVPTQISVTNTHTTQNHYTGFQTCYGPNNALNYTPIAFGSC